MRQGHPDGSSINEKFDVDCISVTRGDGDDQSLVNAVNRFLRPAIRSREVSEHDS
jgi:hypothetical protein